MYNCYIHSVKSGELEEGGMKGREREREREANTHEAAVKFISK